MLPFTLQQLRILKAVATEKNFTKAAELLYISQPSLSKQIKTLEKNLDMELISRENNKISLTENGKVLLQYSERILALCEESCRALIDLKNGDRGHLTVGANQTLGTYLLPKFLVLFAQNYPQIDLNVKINSTQTNLKDVINNTIDAGFINSDEIPASLEKNIVIKDFIEDEFNLIIPKSHPFATRKRITKEDLYHLNFITLNSNSTIQKFIDNRLIHHQIDTKKLKIIMQLHSIEGIKIAVNLGLGAAFLSSSTIEKELQLKTIKILKIEDIQITRNLSLISHPESYKSKSFEFFYKELSRLKSTIEN